jgi:hypothetical protein
MEKWIIIFGGPKPGVYYGWGNARAFANGYKVHAQGYKIEAEARRVYEAGLDAYLEAKRKEKEKEKEKDKPGTPLW